MSVEKRLQEAIQELKRKLDDIERCKTRAKEELHLLEELLNPSAECMRLQEISA